VLSCNWPSVVLRVFSVYFIGHSASFLHEFCILCLRLFHAVAPNRNLTRKSSAAMDVAHSSAAMILTIDRFGAVGGILSHACHGTSNACHGTHKVVVFTTNTVL
jgi:hypothetical protein